MRRERIGANVVVVAQHFNPSVVNQLWLVRHGLMAEEEFEPGSIFMDGLVQVCTRRFILLVTPEQLQIVPRVPDEEQDALIANAVGTVVRTLPHTPFRALGLNFTWHLVPDDGNGYHTILCVAVSWPVDDGKHYATGVCSQLEVIPLRDGRWTIAFEERESHPPMHIDSGDPTTFTAFADEVYVVVRKYFDTYALPPEAPSRPTLGFLRRI